MEGLPWENMLEGDTDRQGGSNWENFLAPRGKISSPPQSSKHVATPKGPKAGRQRLAVSWPGEEAALKPVQPCPRKFSDAPGRGGGGSACV